MTTTDDEDRPKPKRKILCGVNLTLEEEADQILAEYRKGVRKHSDKQDYLSVHQLKKRKQKEIYVNAGVPDASLYSGIFGRAYNPDGGGTAARARKMREIPWSD